MVKTLDLNDGAEWAGEKAKEELQDIRRILADWIEFSKDITTHDPMSDEILFFLRERTINHL